MALVISTWRWGDKYPEVYLDRLRSSVARNMRGQYQFRCFVPGEEDAHLTRIPGCFARLRMFSPDWQSGHGLSRGDVLVCLDLDMVVTGELDPLFARDSSFVILQGANAVNPCPYNGSVMMLRCGEHAEVWDSFSLEAASKTKFHSFPDDQGWLWHVLPESEGWQVGSSSGIYAFKKPGWPRGDDLPAGARLVAFFGWRDPMKFYYQSSWIRDHWR